MRSLWHRYIRAAILALAFAFLTAPLGARTVIGLNSRWTFFTSEETDTDRAATVYLPHTWNADGSAPGGTFYRGAGNYLREVEIPAEWEGRRVFLRIGGAATVADLFVNSRHTASHRGASSAFTVEITDRLLWGRPNTLRIVVDNSPRLDVLPTAGAGNVYGGIYRGVEMIVCDPLSISPASHGGDGVRITTTRLTSQAAEGVVEVELLGPHSIYGIPARPDNAAAIPSGARARIRFTDAEGNLVSQTSVPIDTAALASTLSIPFTVANPRLWQGAADPYLYGVEVTLTYEGESVPESSPTGSLVAGEVAAIAARAQARIVTADSLTVSTGFRTVGIDEANNFLLNGKPLKIRGVIVHRDRMTVGSALTPFQIEEDVALIREMGANAVRVAGGQHSDYFYTLCDEAGLLVWNDSPFTGAAYPTDIDFVDTPRFRENGRRQLTEMIAQLGNHPCVVAWGLFSNISTHWGDDPVGYVRQLDELAHRLDPSRLTAASSVSDGEINSITDLISFDLSFGWTQGLPDGVVPWLEQLRRRFPHLRAGISYSAGGSIFQQAERLERPDPLGPHHPEGWQAFFHEQYIRGAVDAPGLWGVFVGNMFDFGDARSTSGDGRGIDDRGLVTFDRKERKDAWWAYKAVWNSTEPFVHIAGKRLDTRSERRQRICVYSNQSEVELFVGGRSQGRRRGEKGVFIWDGVELRGGINRLEARSGDLSDRASVNLFF